MPSLQLHFSTGVTPSSSTDSLCGHFFKIITIFIVTLSHKQITCAYHSHTDNSLFVQTLIWSKIHQLRRRRRKRRKKKRRRGRGEEEEEKEERIDYFSYILSCTMQY